jgi:long-chain acyl-CoA synthetase
MSTQTQMQSAAERGSGSQTLAAMAAAIGTRPGAAFRHKAGGAWTETSFAEVGVAVREIAGGLIALGLGRGDRVGILSDTLPEWTLVDLGATSAATTVVPVYHTNSPSECRYVLAHADVKAVFCENAEQVAKIDKVRAELPGLEHVIAIEGAPEGTATLAELRELGRGVDPERIDEAIASVEPDDLATVIYTSGTTGPPKGCMVTHANWTATIRMYEERLELAAGDPVVIFLFLPLAHSLARITQFVSLDVGGTIAYWSRSRDDLLDDIVATRPTHIPSVPRVFEKIHAKALEAAEDSGFVQRRIFDWAVQTGRAARAAERAGARPGLALRAGMTVADRLVLGKVRGLFGPDIRLALTGAAPVSRAILEFFDACGVLVVEGYGMTETCAAATLNTPREVRFGTVGRPLPGVEVRIAADGEVLMRGPNLFIGYHKDPEATAETFEGDWLRSGDLGVVDPDGYVSITGRKKDLIITSSGKNISPSNIETALRETRWISQAVVYGDGRPYLVALLTLEPDELPALAEHVGLGEGEELRVDDERVRAAVQADVDAVNANLARIEQVKRFEILDHDLSQQAGELTPTLKIKRAVVNDRYRERLEALYR